MVCNIFYISKTAKIDSNFTNISLNTYPNASPEQIYGCIEVSMHCL